MGLTPCERELSGGIQAAKKPGGGPKIYLIAQIFLPFFGCVRCTPEDNVHNACEAEKSGLCCVSCAP
jgi:hypothetical protein